VLNIQVDIYSGLPNPTFTLSEQEARNILKEIALNKGVITNSNVRPSHLGYRGINISFQSDNIPHQYGLPASFGLANGLSMLESKGREIAESLLQSSSTSSASLLNGSPLSPTLTKWVINQVKDLPSFSYFKNEEHQLFKSEDETLPCAFEKVAFEPGFWNETDHVSKNNCYNFATNRRTDTFAQPGRASGHTYNEITCEIITNGAIADGSHKVDSCFQESEKPRFLMALVVAPGPEFVDYHWYRQCSDGSWGHKPGHTPARNTDESNQVITDPSKANRGPYTLFCGYMLAPKSMNVN